MIGELCMSRPNFCSIDDVIIPVFFRFCFKACEVRT